MRRFEDFNPIVLFLYYAETIAIVMLTMHPAILAVSLSGAVLCCNCKMRTHLAFLALFIVSALVNPLFSHGGMTVLFVMNDNPVTLEATLYGVGAAAVIVSVLYRARSLSRIMTSDKLLYLFGALSPKFALVLSMSMRYIPLFGTQRQRIVNAQKAIGRYRTDSVPARLKSEGRVLSVMVTWALENGIITADSMAARGYGMGRRTHFSLFRFRRTDFVFLLISASLFALTCAGIADGSLSFEFYPRIGYGSASVMACASVIAYCALSLMPLIIEAGERIKWNCLRSKI